MPASTGRDGVHKTTDGGHAIIVTAGNAIDIVLNQEYLHAAREERSLTQLAYTPGLTIHLRICPKQPSLILIVPG